MPYIIGIAGKHQAGKSTYAEKLKFLLESYLHKEGPKVHIAAFASPVKAMGAFLTGGPVVKEAQYRFGNRWISGRMILEGIGTGLREILSPTIWVAALMRQIETQHPDEDIVIIDDVRFPNEAAVCDLIIFIRSSKNDELGVLPSERELLQVWEKANLRIQRKGCFYDHDPESFVPRIIEEWRTYITDHDRWDSQSTAYGD